MRALYDRDDALLLVIDIELANVQRTEIGRTAFARATIE